MENIYSVLYSNLSTSQSLSKLSIQVTICITLIIMEPCSYTNKVGLNKYMHESCLEGMFLFKWNGLWLIQLKLSPASHYITFKWTEVIRQNILLCSVKLPFKNNSINNALANSKLFLLREIKVRLLLSSNQYITLFYVCFYSKMPQLCIVDALI